MQNNKVKRALVAAGAIATIASAGGLIATAKTNYDAAVALRTMRIQKLAGSAALCESAKGRWSIDARGAAHCETDSIVRTTQASADACHESGGKPRKEAGLYLCDYAK